MDGEGHYAGVAPLEAAFSDWALEPGKAGAPVSTLAINIHDALSPHMAIKEIMQAFDRTEADELIVVDTAGKPLGVLSEAFATRRYAEELEKAHRDLTGDG